VPDVKASSVHREETPVKTVYFLGAGASKAISGTMPTAEELTVGHLFRPGSYPNETFTLREFEERMDRRWRKLSRRSVP
jgi:hypothetical protein